MSKIDEVQWRLLCERLAQEYQQAQRQESGTLPNGLLPDGNAEILLRLAGTALTLLEWHAIDAKGRCRARVCMRRRWVPWRRRGRCHVFVTVQFWILQPLAVVKKVGRRYADYRV